MIEKRIIRVKINNYLSLLDKICDFNLKNILNDYKLIIYNYDSIYIYIKSEYPQYLNLFLELNIENKIFLFILLELYQNGGIYIENNFFLYKKLDELLKYNISIFPLLDINNIGNYCILSNKNNKFILYLITKIFMYYNNNNNFITSNILYKLYLDYKNYIYLIQTDYKNCFGNFGYNINNNTLIDNNIKNKKYCKTINYDKLYNNLFYEMNFLQNIHYKLI